MRCIITGTTARTRARCSAVARRVSSGSNFGAQHHRRRGRQAQHEVEEAPRVEERRRDHRGLPVAARNLREQGGQGAQALRLAALGSLRGAGRPRREDDVAALLRGGIDVIAVGAGDQLLQRRLVGPLLLLPGDEVPKTLAHPGEQLGELLVVDQDRRVLALHDIGELRAGEGGVQVERDRTQLRARHRRLDEVTVVAAHDRDAVALQPPPRRGARAPARSSGGGFAPRSGCRPRR